MEYILASQCSLRECRGSMLPVCPVSSPLRSPRCLFLSTTTTRVTQFLMAPKSRSGAVSSASFLDLKAELSKKEDEFKKSKARGNGKAEAIVGGVKREEKVRSNAQDRISPAHATMPIENTIVDEKE